MPTAQAARSRPRTEPHSTAPPELSFLLDPALDARYRSLTEEQVRALYLVERELRGRLLAAPPARRAETFLGAYDELFRRCPFHPALRDPEESEATIRRRTEQVLPLLDAEPPATILEIGCGSGELALSLAAAGYRATGIDVSQHRIDRLQLEHALEGRQSVGLQMPRGGTPLDNIDLTNIRNWINNGAPNN